MVGAIEGVRTHSTEASPFVFYMKKFSVENNAHLIGRIAKVSTRTPYKILLLLRQVSKEFASSPEFTKVVALHSVFMITVYSQHIFMRSLFLTHFDALSFHWEVPNSKRFLDFMSARQEVNAPALKHVAFYLQESICPTLLNMPDEQFAAYFGELDSCALPSMIAENSAFHDFINQLGMRFHLQSQMKKLIVTPFIAQIVDEDLQKVLSSVQDIDFWLIGLDPAAIVRILTLYQGKALKRLYFNVPMQVAQKSLTEEEQKRLFGELKELTITSYILPEKESSTFKKCLMSQSLVDVEIKGASDFLSSFSDQEMREIFHVVKILRIERIAPVDLMRVLSSSLSLRELYVPLRSLLASVPLFPDQSLQSMFQNMRVLYFDLERGQPVDMVIKLLGFMPHLREVSLMMTAEFSAKIMMMSCQEMERLFGKIRRLHLYNLGMSEAAFVRIMKYAVNIDHLNVINNRELNETLVRNRSPQVLRDIFGRLRVLTYEHSDFLENAEALCQFVEAACCLESLSFKGRGIVGMTEADLEGLSEEALLRLARLAEPLAQCLPPEIVGYLLNYLPGILPDVVFLQNEAVNFIRDEHMGRVIDGVQMFESDSDAKQDILIYRLLKSTSSFEKFDADHVENVSALFDNLSVKEFQRGFSSLCSFNLKEKFISERALRKLFTHCTTLTELRLAQCSTLNDVVLAIDEKVLERAFANLTLLDVSGAVQDIGAITKILKATRNLQSLNLNQCWSILEVNAALSDEEFRVVFGQLRELDVSETRISEEFIIRLFKVAQSLERLNWDKCLIAERVKNDALDEQALSRPLAYLSIFSIATYSSIIERVLRRMESIETLVVGGDVLDLMKRQTDDQLKEIFGKMKVLIIKGKLKSRKQIARLSNCCPDLKIKIETVE